MNPNVMEVTMVDLLKAAREALEEALEEAVTQSLLSVIIELEYSLENIETALILVKQDG